MPVDTSLHKAANQGDVEACKDIIASGEVDINAPGAADRTAIQRACGANHMELVKVLLELGADPNKKDKAGRTCIHWCAIGGHVEPMQFLMDNGKLDVNAKNNSSSTALHAAAEGGKMDVVCLLVGYHEKVTAGEVQGSPLEFEIQDSDGKTPFDYAKQGKHMEICKMIKEKRLLKEGEGGKAGCLVM